jgi:hypothetical protein
MLVLASAFILRSESRRTHDHILLSQIRDSPNAAHESSLMLGPKVCRPVYLGIKHPSGAYDQIFITVRRLRVVVSYDSQDYCGGI